MDSKARQISFKLIVLLIWIDVTYSKEEKDSMLKEYEHAFVKYTLRERQMGIMYRFSRYLTARDVGIMPTLKLERTQALSRLREIENRLNLPGFVAPKQSLSLDYSLYWVNSAFVFPTHP